MNIEFAKQLMQTLGIPLQKAIELIQKQGEDITLCQKALYDERIQEIVYQTGLVKIKRRNTSKNSPTLKKPSPN